jgi:DNA primase large subunit
MTISDFPFSRQAAEHVREAGYSLESLLEKRAFLPVKRRAIDRVKGALEGEIPDESFHPEVELLSYPLARVIVSCLDDPFLIRRYALAEAKLGHRRMRRVIEILPLAEDLGLHPTKDGDMYRLHFTEYISAAHRMRSPRWKLVNRDLDGGVLSVTQAELLRLLEEKVRDRVLKGLPLEVSDEICAKLSDSIGQIRTELESIKSEQMVDLGAVNEGAFPPCIKVMLSQVAGGVNLAHSARFALTSFLLFIGMSVDDVIGVFNTSTDFDEERTRYQVEHIAGASGTKYKPPSCSTMATYGNCPGEDDLCKRIRHPMSYYRRGIKKFQS